MLHLNCIIPTKTQTKAPRTPIAKETTSNKRPSPPLPSKSDQDTRSKGVILESWEAGSSSSEADDDYYAFEQQQVSPEPEEYPRNGQIKRQIRSVSICEVEASSPKQLATELKDVASNGIFFARSQRTDDEIRGIEAQYPQHLATELKDIASHENSFAKLQHRDNEIRGVEAHSHHHLATELKDIASKGHIFAKFEHKDNEIREVKAQSPQNLAIELKDTASNRNIFARFKHNDRLIGHKMNVASGRYFENVAVLPHIYLILSLICSFCRLIPKQIERITTQTASDTNKKETLEGEYCHLLFDFVRFTHVAKRENMNEFIFTKQWVFYSSCLSKSFISKKHRDKMITDLDLNLTFKSKFLTPRKTNHPFAIFPPPFPFFEPFSHIFLPLSS
jgi:hypothetical protein